MTEPDPQTVDAFLTDLLARDDEALTAGRLAADEAGLPSIAVSPVQGKFLGLLARAIGARRILEIGTLGGYSTIHLARGLAPGGRLVTSSTPPSMRRSPARTSLAPGSRTSPRSAWVARSTPCPRSRARCSTSSSSTPTRRPTRSTSTGRSGSTRPGGLIVGDNVVRQGRILAPDDADTAGIRTFLEALAADPRLDGTVLQTVGSKGWDGLAVAVRL